MQQLCRAYGVWFEVGCDDPELMSGVLDRLPPGTRRTTPAGGPPAFICTVTTDRPRPDGDDVRVVSLDGAELQRSYDAGPALELFESTVRFEVVRRARRWTFVHAGVVAWQGTAIVIPGVSRSGKSTLVKALVETGATYYSDEYAALDSRGRVFPFAQPLMERTESDGRLRLSVAEMGGTVGLEPLPVGLVVSTQYETESEWNPVTLSPGATVLAMLANTVRAQADPPRSIRVLATVAERAEAIETVRGDAASVVGDILARAERSRSLTRSIA
jgi:hypothetical protein